MNRHNVNFRTVDGQDLYEVAQKLAALRQLRGEGTGSVSELVSDLIEEEAQRVGLDEVEGLTPPF